MYNKLLRRQYRAQNHGKVDELRCSGRSTALAMGAIASAIQRPGEDVEILRHGDEPATAQQAHYRADLTRKIIDKLGLLHMRVKLGDNRAYVVSEMFTDNPWEIT